MNFIAPDGKSFPFPVITDSDNPVMVLKVPQDLPTPPAWINRATMRFVNGFDPLTFLPQYKTQATFRDRPGDWEASDPQQGRAISVGGYMTCNHPNGKAVFFSAANALGNGQYQRDSAGKIVVFPFFEYHHLEIFNVFRTDNVAHTDAFWLGGGPTAEQRVSGYVHDCFTHHMGGSAAVLLLNEGWYDTVMVQNYRVENAGRSNEVGGAGGHLLVLDNVSGCGLAVNAQWDKIVVRNSPELVHRGWWHAAGIKDVVVVDDAFALPAFAGGSVPAPTPPTPTPTPVPVPVPAAASVSSVQLNYDDGRPPEIFIRKT